MPYGLLQRDGFGDDEQYQINGFFVGLARYATASGGRAGLVSWRHGLDACGWLAEHGVADPDCDGSGAWVEDGAALRFVLLWLVDRQMQAAPLDGFEQAPVDAVLVVAADTDAEPVTLDHPAGHGLPAVMACTTVAVLDGCGDGPAGPVWATTPDEAVTNRRRRLIDLAPTARDRRRRVIAH